MVVDRWPVNTPNENTPDVGTRCILILFLLVFIRFSTTALFGKKFKYVQRIIITNNNFAVFVFTVKLSTISESFNDLGELTISETWYGVDELFCLTVTVHYITRYDIIIIIPKYIQVYI